MKRLVFAVAICVLLLGLGWWGWRSGAEGAAPLPPSQANAASVPVAPGQPSEASSSPETASRAPVRRPALAILAADPRTAMAELPDGELRRGLAALPEGVRGPALERLAALRVPFNDYVALRVDLGGNFYYVCAVPPGVATQARAALPDPLALEPMQAAAAAGEIAEAAVPISQPPVRHSRPGATRVAYLDFNGHTIAGTAWNTRYGVTNFVCRAYDTDGDATTFGDAEQAAILRIWARVAEDFAPFDIDVTTEEPAFFDDRTARILITPNVDANGQTNPEGGTAGGVAFVDTFGEPGYAATYSPALVYANRLGTDANVAEAASHELGHNLALSHDGTTTLPYYGGHGTGDTSWGPIMGTGYGRNVSQWSKGDYYEANNAQDDLATLAQRLTYRTDDAGDSVGTARALSIAGTAVSGGGVIERGTDADRFVFTTGAGGVTLNVTPFRSETGTRGGNLDVKAELYDAAGTLVAVADPTATTSASLTLSVAAGTYYLRVMPVGAGAPLTNPAAGYSAYGSLGAYTITGTIVVPTTAAAPVVTAQPRSQTVTLGSAVVVSVAAIGTAPLAYEWRKDGQPVAGGGQSELTLSGVQLANAGRYRVVVSNSVGSVESDEAVLTVTSTAVAPTITTQPASQSVMLGSPATFGVTATGTAPLAYQWRRNGVNLVGANEATLTLPATGADSAGGYSVAITNAAGTTTSAAALLSLNWPPVFTEHPVSRAVAPGGTVTFSAAATGGPAPTLQWQRSTDSGTSWGNLANGTGITGAATDTLSLSAVAVGSSGHRFRCVATNAVGSATSGAATLTVAVLPVVTAIAAGVNHVLYLKADGTVWASGDNSSGQLGHGGFGVAHTPAQIAEGAVAVAAGQVHSLVLKADGTLWAAGGNSFGQLGDGTTTDRPTFELVGTEVAGIAARSYESAFIRRDGTLWTMGRNAAGQLGQGTTTQQNFPVPVATGVRSVSLGDAHLLYVTAAGELRAVGGNSSGQLGDGTTVNRLAYGVMATGVREAMAGYRSSYFLLPDGTQRAVGDNTIGQLGDGSATLRTVPVTTGSDRTAVSSGFTHVLSVSTTGQLRAHGDNRFSQLGDGTVVNRAVPVVVAETVVTAEAGASTSYWVKADGSTWAVGKNLSGQLGDGSTVNRRTPGQIFVGVPAVPGVPAAVSVSQGSSSEFARVTWEHLAGGVNYEVWRHTENNPVAAVRVAKGERVNFFEDRSGVAGTTYFYWVRAVGAGGAGAWGAAATGYRVAPNTALSVVRQPVSATGFVGDSVSFVAGFAGAPPPMFQWQVSTNGGAIWSALADGSGYQGTTTTELRLPMLAAELNGYHYRCIATNDAGSATTAAAILTVNLQPRAPVVTRQPVAPTVTEGSPANFTVEATGTAPLAYQWRLNGTPIPGAPNAASYSVSAVQFSHAGTYDVVVSNGVGTATSSGALLVVNAPELFTPRSHTLSSVSQGAVIRINTTGPWSITETSPWLICLPSSGTGSTSVTMLVTANAETTARSATALINGQPYVVTQLPVGGLDQWAWRNPQPKGLSLRGLASNSSMLVAVGDRDAVQTSEDGLTWTTTSSGTQQGLIGVAWGAGRFVAVGGSGEIRTSPDGRNWSGQVSGTSNVLFSVTWNGSTFVAVGNSGEIRTSPDGITWTARASGTTSSLRSVGWMGGQFVAVGFDGTIRTSPDGATWTARTSGTTNSFLGLCHNGALWVATGLQGILCTSPDGVNWINRTLADGGALYAGAWDGSMFVVVASGGRIFTSPDGVTWTSRVSPVVNDLLAVHWTGARFLVVGRGGTTLASDNGTHWSLLNSATAEWLRDVAWGGDRYVVVGDRGTLLTSPDGDSWTRHDLGTSSDLLGVSWSGNVFVVTGAGGELFTSPDAQTWTRRVSGTTQQLWKTLWNGHQFLVVGNDPHAYTSPDGITWTPHATGASVRLFDIAWNGQLYVVVGDGGVIYTSPDGITWTQRNSPARSTLTGVAWNGSLFAAVGTNGELTTSPDGVNWTKVTLPFTPSLQAITWNGYLFVAVGTAGASVASADGVNWTFRNTLPSEGLYGLTWRGDRFLAVGMFGGIMSTVENYAYARPVIAVHPQSQTVANAGNVELSVVATGSPAPTYQWRQGGVPMVGATAPTLRVQASPATAAGAYDVIVSNSVGIVTSKSASITVVDGYAAWTLGYFSASESLDPAVGALAADPDGDGLSNLLEYALGLEPRTATPEIGLPQVTASGSDWVYTYTRPAARSDVTYAVEVSTTLTSWTTSGVQHEFVSSTGGIDTWRARYPMAGAASAFFRLKVSAGQPEE